MDKPKVTAEIVSLYDMTGRDEFRTQEDAIAEGLLEKSRMDKFVMIGLNTGVEKKDYAVYLNSFNLDVPELIALLETSKNLYMNGGIRPN